MIELKQHPILKALLLPLTNDEYEILKNDIKEHGIQIPIIHDKDGNIIDGWNRYSIAKELEIEPPTQEREYIDNVVMGISLNLRRRHLSIEQRNKLILTLREKGWTQQKAAEVTGITQPMVSRIEKTVTISDSTSNMQIDIPTKPDRRKKLTSEEETQIGEETKTQTQKQVAKKHGVSQQKVAQIVKGKKKKNKRNDALYQLKKWWDRAGKRIQQQFLKWIEEETQKEAKK